MMIHKDYSPLSPEWRVSDGLVPYPEALAAMDTRVDGLLQGRDAPLIWLLEHPPLYTAGTSARASDLLDAQGLPVHQTGRGGKHTYHGPGQRVVYVMLDLAKQDRDLRAHVWRLEEWILRTLADFGVAGARRAGRVGIWVVMPDGNTEKKIAAIGVRARRWVTSHGFSINIDPALSRFAGIVPCGIAEHGVTSLRDLGCAATLAQVDEALRRHAPAVMGFDL